MFLKRLEIMGFKSFADRIGIDFVPGVTAVVGPNGSGKSNVTDAIRWVLGEQSAKSLRGAKMEDVIFSGSDSRKSLNVAEVTLVLDNTDERIPLAYSEISVTRRVFRSGESAYLLNKQPCRLKDITDLFMDSGLGKEAFSIISQGRVDEILNSKADERRSIFEEAAGVLKYKQRKRKAEVKLNETDENLSRVLDILHELDDRMEPLQMQASAARDYLEMSSELKESDLALTSFDLAAFQKELTGLAEESAVLSGKEQEIGAAIEEKETLVQKLRKQLSGHDRKIDENQTVLVEASAETEKWEGRKLLMSEKRSNAAQQADQLKKNLELEQADMESLDKRYSEENDRLQEERAAHGVISDKLKHLNSQLTLSPADIEKEIESLKSDYIDLLNEQAGIRNELKNIELQKQQLSATSDRVESQRSHYETALTKLEAEKDKAQKDLEATQARLEELRAAYREADSSFKAKKESFGEKQSMLFQAYQSQKQLAARIDTLEELESDFSGFFQGVREVLKARSSGQLPGVIGAVAEMVTADNEHAKAIETALGAASQHIITASEKDARSAIEFLREKRAGRATFLPMTVMKARTVPESLLAAVREHPAFVSVAAELVKSDAAHKEIVWNLLGNVIIAKDLKGAATIAKSLMSRYRVVTLSGDVINAGGSMTGGASKNQSSLFTRKAELEGLKVKAADLAETILSAEKSVQEEQKTLAVAEQQAEALRTDGEGVRNTEADQLIGLREIEAVWKTTKSRYELFLAEETHKEDDRTAIEKRQEAAQSHSVQLEKDLAELTAKIDEMTELKEKDASMRDAILTQLADQKSAFAVSKERISRFQQSERELADRLAASKVKLAALQKELEWLESDGAAKVYADEEVIDKIAHWSKKKEQTAELLSQLKKDRSGVQRQMDELAEQLKEAQRVHKGFTEAIQMCNVKSTRVEVQIQNLELHLEEQYSMTAKDAAAYEMTEEEHVVRKQVKLLKQSIEELGPVNLNAIEEFDMVSERHRFLTEQRDDLNEAKATLRTLIEEMDEEMTSRFDETFRAIRDQFQVVFRELFGGGAADLVLTDPKDLLGTGVDIIAQPPGKKLQHLSLLSGGERALTAIALLFAILKVRPVPFCVLDEVEAALDESNVVRYSQYLKRFSADTQFIVITHRKGTMEGADVLYGITMQESGISKLVSVKLQEVE